MLFWKQINYYTNRLNATTILFEICSLLVLNFSFKNSYELPVLNKLFSDKQLLYPKISLKKKRSLAQPPVSIYLNKYYWTKISHRVIVLELENIEIYDLFEEAPLLTTCVVFGYYNIIYTDTGVYKLLTFYADFMLNFGCMTSLNTNSSNTNVFSAMRDSYPHIGQLNLNCLKFFKIPVVRHADICNFFNFTSNRLTLFITNLSCCCMYLFSRLNSNRESVGNVIAYLFFITHLFSFVKIKATYRPFPYVMLYNTILWNSLATVKYRNNNPSSEVVGLISVTSKKKYVGISLSFRFAQSKFYGSTIFFNTKQLKQNYKLITTISTAILTKLFLLPKPSKLQPITYLLLGKLTRRYLLLLNIYSLNFTFKNYLENFEHFWKYLFQSSGEIINHPTFFFFLSDLNIKLDKNFTLTFNSQLFSYLRQLTSLEQDVLYLITEKVNAGILSKKYLIDFPLLFNNLIRRNVLNLYNSFKSGKVMDNKLKLTIADFKLDCGIMQLCNTTSSTLTYKKKIRSIKRRISKRITKETSRRVWPF